MPCKATDQNVATACQPPGAGGEPVIIQIFDPYEPDCEGAGIEIIDCPLRGVVVDAGSGMLEYTPCENFAGTDDFSYTITGSQDPDPGIGVVRINVKGNNCDWYEGERCDGERSDPRVWVHKEFVERHGYNFYYEGECYEARRCSTCPLEEPDGVKLKPEETQPLLEGCEDPICDEPDPEYGCYWCGQCCFSSESTLDISISNVNLPDVCCDDEISSGGSESALVFQYSNGMETYWQKQVGDLYYTAVYQCEDDPIGVDKGWRLVIVNASISCAIQARPYDALGCCGGSASSVLAYSNADQGYCIYEGSADATVTVHNNKCCQCDDDGQPRCKKTAADYGGHCINEANTCDPELGDSPSCDDAAP